jgi:hypothetical protein
MRCGRPGFSRDGFFIVSTGIAGILRIEGIAGVTTPDLCLKA